MTSLRRMVYVMWRTDVGLDASCEAVYDDNKKQEKVESIIYPLLQ